MIVQIPLGLSNAFLVRGERPVLIDTGRAADVPALLRALERLGVPARSLSLIVHSHVHWDHCGGSRQLRAATGVPVAVQRGDVERLRRGDNGPVCPTGPAGHLLPLLFPSIFPGLEPDIILDGETDLRPFGVDARVLPTPGHTAGSVTILTADGEAVVGDLLMGGFLGGKLLPTRPGLHYCAEDLPTLRTSLRTLLTRGPHTFYVGHGGPLLRAAVVRRFGREIGL